MAESQFNRDMRDEIEDEADRPVDFESSKPDGEDDHDPYTVAAAQQDDAGVFRIRSEGVQGMLRSLYTVDGPNRECRTRSFDRCDMTALLENLNTAWRMGRDAAVKSGRIAYVDSVNEAALDALANRIVRVTFKWTQAHSAQSSAGFKDDIVSMVRDAFGPESKTPDGKPETESMSDPDCRPPSKTLACGCIIRYDRVPPQFTNFVARRILCGSRHKCSSK